MTVKSRRLVPPGGMNGTPADLKSRLAVCELCDGTGELYVPTTFQGEYDGHTEVECPDCCGSGEVVR